MQQKGETSNFTVNDHIDTLLKHAPGIKIDAVLINSYHPSPARLLELENDGIGITEYNRKEVANHKLRVILRDVIDLDHPMRHDSQKLADAVIAFYNLDSNN